VPWCNHNLDSLHRAFKWRVSVQHNIGGIQLAKFGRMPSQGPPENEAKVTAASHGIASSNRQLTEVEVKREAIASNIRQRKSLASKAKSLAHKMGIVSKDKFVAGHSVRNKNQE
jgi:hypothetical protein